MKALVQLERITFRAVLILLLRTALFLCSECDTFLMNYIMSEDGSVVALTVRMNQNCFEM